MSDNNESTDSLLIRQMNRISELEKQNDELLAALEAAQQRLYETDHGNGHPESLYIQIESAIEMTKAVS